MSIVIAVPAQDTVATGFAIDLAGLQAEATKAGLDTKLLVVRGTYVPQQRVSLVREALKREDLTHIFWLDSDMRFPKDTLSKLIAHDLPIVGANYSTRRAPILPTAETKEAGPVFFGDNDSGLVEVAHVGMGVLLTKAEVFRKMSAPWFALGYNSATGDFVGEDVFFMRKAKEVGFATMVDLDLSKHVSHIGEMEYRYQHSLMTHDAMLARIAEAQNAVQ